MDNYESFINSLSAGIPALFLILRPAEREKLREMLQAVSDRNELRNPDFSAWMNNLLNESAILTKRHYITINRGGENGN